MFAAQREKVGSRGLRLLIFDDFNPWAVREYFTALHPGRFLRFAVFAMDLSLVFVLATVVYLLALRLIPTRKRALRFVCMSALFTVQTILIVALIGSPFSPEFGVDPTVMSPAANSITAAPAERSYQGRTAHTDSRAPISAGSARRSRVVSAVRANVAAPGPSESSAC